MDFVSNMNIPILLASVGALLLLLVNQGARRWSLPAPALFLGLGILVNGWSHVVDVRVHMTDVAAVGSVALVLILFEGGFSGGFSRARSAIGPILGLGIIGTFATTAALAAAAHYIGGLAWAASVILGIALAPTDPAAVFSILGNRDVEGRSSAVIEGESGVNDPVSIALMAGALAYLAGAGSVLHVGVELARELVVGLLLGVLFGRGGAALLGRVRLGSESLFPFAAIAMAFLVYSATNMMHGSGYLAVFVAGMIMGDRLRAHHNIEALVSLCSALAEIAMFTLLGMTVALEKLGDAFGTGLIVFGVLTLVIRPLTTALLLVPTRLSRAERIFIGWGGLRGAVPILLAAFAVLEHVPDASRVYSIVFVAVAASICIQGGTIPTLIDRLGLVNAPEAES